MLKHNFKSISAVVFKTNEWKIDLYLFPYLTLIFILPAVFTQKSAKKRVKLYKEYLSVRDANYLNWAIYNVLNWKQEKNLENVVHIQGDDDHIFPIKHIKNCIPIENGTHIMILNKAKSISKIIIDALKSELIRFTARLNGIYTDKIKYHFRI